MKYPNYLPNDVALKHRENGFYDLWLGDEIFPYHLAAETIWGELSAYAEGVGVVYLPVLFEHDPADSGEFTLDPDGLGE